jgi:hypothetical protein
MKEIEGLTEENGAVYYEHNGEKINLTEIGDECGTLHMRKAMKMLMAKADLDAKTANNIIYEAYKETPPNRAKNQRDAEKIKENNEEIAHLKEAKRQVKEIAAQQKAKG